MLLHNWIFWLIIITGLAIIIRSIPAWINAAWGCDFGIYFGITKNVVQSGTLFPPYSGWGGSYNEFPVLYAINASAHWISGIDVIVIMPKLMPIFGGLSVLIFYFIVRKLTDNKKIALLSCLFFAFLPFHVYQTSHASPLTLGHFFTMLSLFLFLKFRENTKYIVPLFISTVLLIMSHHLSTYVYLISLIGILFVENASVKDWKPTFKRDVFYIIITSFLIFSYWALVARTVFEKFMYNIYIGGVRVQPIFIVIAFYLVLVFLFGIIKYIRKFNEYIVKLKREVKAPIKKIIVKIIWRIYTFVKKKWPSTRSRILLFFSVLISLLGIMLLFSFIEMPWLGFSLTIDSIIFSLPLVIAIAFGAIGFRYTWYIKNGVFVRGWLISILASLVIMMITRNNAILPHRHPEYLMAPLAIIMVYGIGGLFSDPFYLALFSKIKGKREIYVSYLSGKIRILQKNRIISLFIVIILVLSLAGTTYAVHRLLDQSWEEITSEDIASVDWIGENLDKNSSIITSDHRLERMAEAEGFNTSEDEIVKLWSAENISEYIYEILGIGKEYNRITHVIIDDIMKYKGVHIGPDKGKFRTIYMTNKTWNASYEKFKKQPFELVYRNETLQVNPETLEPLHWTEVYEINWTYLEEIYLPSLNDDIGR